MIESISPARRPADTGVQFNSADNLSYRIFFYYIPWLATLVIIFSLSSQPATALPAIEIPLSDKIAHIFEYSILGLFTLRVFSLRLNRGSARNKGALLRLYAASLVFVVLAGIADEIHQIFVPGRYFDLLDLATDFAGVILVIAIHRLWLRNVSASLPH